MPLSLIRVDDRLIHGQVMAVWLRARRAQTIVIADDDTAADEFLAEVLTYAAPPGVEVEVFSVDGAAARLTELQGSSQDAFLLMKSPVVAVRLKEVTSKLRAEAKSYEMALTEFELTMERIGLDYLDLYLVHCPWRSWDPKDMADHLPAENREIWKAMEEFLASGRVKAIGVSNYSRGDFENLLPICEVKPMANQIQWFIGKDVADTVAICREHDMVVEAYSPFAHGLIVNHPEIAEIAEKYGASAPQLCIRYLLQHGAVVLPKATSPAHIRANAETDFVISDADMELLDAMRDTDTHPDAPAVRWP